MVDETEKWVWRERASCSRAELLMSMPLMLCELSVLCLPSLWLAARLSVKYCMGNCHFHAIEVFQLFDSPMMPDEVCTVR